MALAAPDPGDRRIPDAAGLANGAPGLGRIAWQRPWLARTLAGSRPGTDGDNAAVQRGALVGAAPRPEDQAELLRGRPAGLRRPFRLQLPSFDDWWGCRSDLWGGPGVAQPAIRGGHGRDGSGRQRV